MDQEEIGKAFSEMWSQLSLIGGDPTGGYHRFAFSAADTHLRSWFRSEAERRGLTFEVDCNTNMWAWTDPAAVRVVGTGSHLDSVPGGGAFDGPLGVVSAFLALDLLGQRMEGLPPVAVVAFTEEEGGRFGVACLGSKLATGDLSPETARSLRDGEGVELARAAAQAGFDPSSFRPDPERLDRLGCFIELHCEQGRALRQPVGLASAVWPHGRWRYTFNGEANHAGTTRLADRRDPMLAAAALMTSARIGAQTAGAVATVGRIAAHPNATNGIADRVDVWLDARAPDEAGLDALVDSVDRVVYAACREHEVDLRQTRESYLSEVRFDAALNRRLQGVLGEATPVIPTAAGHDAAVLAGHLPATMLFVRNPTGASHTPHEHVDIDDCIAGVEALAEAIEALA